MLASTDLAGAPAEFFEPALMPRLCEAWGVSELPEYVEALLARKTSSNGVFGIKAMYPQVKDALGATSPAAFFPNLRYVYVTRRDHVGQAVSFARAIQTDQWTSRLPKARPPRFDHAQIADLLVWIEREERAWEGFFQSEGVTPLRVVYEDCVSSLRQTVQSVLEFIEVRVPENFAVPAPTIAKQADHLSEEWKRRFEGP